MESSRDVQPCIITRGYVTLGTVDLSMTVGSTDTEFRKTSMLRPEELPSADTTLKVTLLVAIEVVIPLMPTASLVQIVPAPSS